jgi:phosphohistidine phosphatase
MKHLFLIRHAKSSWENLQLSDHDRPLNQRGIRDANQQAQALNDYAVQPECIFTSSAIRALTYAKKLSQVSGCQLQVEPSLYTFSLRELANVVAHLPSELNSVAIVGHNPAIHNVFNQLSNHIVDKFPTSAIAHITLDSDSWQAIEHTVGTLQWLKTPKGKIDFPPQR